MPDICKLLYMRPFQYPSAHLHLQEDLGLTTVSPIASLYFVFLSHTRQCAGFAGSLNHELTDARLFVDLGETDIEDLHGHQIEWTPVRF